MKHLKKDCVAYQEGSDGCPDCLETYDEKLSYCHQYGLCAQDWFEPYMGHGCPICPKKKVEENKKFSDPEENVEDSEIEYQCVDE